MRFEACLQILSQSCFERKFGGEDTGNKKGKVKVWNFRPSGVFVEGFVSSHQTLRLKVLQSLMANSFIHRGLTLSKNLSFEDPAETNKINPNGQIKS